ncbi:Uncharacterised protein [Burkholderia pseudomallei]|nr:Uncharacterised protein [Burkholderia pseudomallei]
MRQPVSATIATRCGSAFGSGNAREATLTSLAFAGSVVSQTDTGKLDGFESAGSLAVGRCAAVPAATRSVIRDSLPSMTSCGHSGSPADAGMKFVITRAIAWFASPISTHAACTLIVALAGSAGISMCFTVASAAIAASEAKHADTARRESRRMDVTVEKPSIH